MLKTNTKAPDFKLPSTSKDKYSLKDSIGKYVVIYFYPKDDTPGCTIETNDFNKLLSKFKKLECEVYGISKDNLKSHDKFRDKYKIKFDLLADEELTVLKKYKVWGKKKFMGREFMGIIRTTFLIDKKGKIINVWEEHVKSAMSSGGAPPNCAHAENYARLLNRKLEVHEDEDGIASDYDTNYGEGVGGSEENDDW